jgi:hypothetical protein
MKRSPVLSFLVLSLVLVVLSQLSLAETKVMTVPRGATFGQTGTGQFRIRGPEWCAIEIKGFQKTSKGEATLSEVGFVGDCGIFDKNGKIIATGTKGAIKSGSKPANPTTGDFIKIGGYTLWLPATIEFTPVRVFNRQALQKLCSPAEPSGAR